MSFNPQVHPGYTTYTPSDKSPDKRQIISNSCLFPIETATVPTTRMMGACMQDYPCMARICALPIAATDTVCTPLVLCADTVWSTTGTIFCGLSACCTCCTWKKGKQATKDFASATVKNINTFFRNLCLGPIIAAGSAVPACAICDYKTCCVSLCCCPIVWPATSLIEIFRICTCPQETGEWMLKELDEIYKEV